MNTDRHRPRRRCVIDTRTPSYQALVLPVVYALLAPLCAGLLLVPDSAEARRKRKPPLLQLEVRRGKIKLGTESLRTKAFEKIVNFSTTAKLRDKGRRFTQRTHTKFDRQDKVIQYNRWVDVKGASTRVIVFPVKDSWKLRSGDTISGRFKLTDLKVESPVVLLDARSPTLVHIAVDRAAGRDTYFVRADDRSSGRLSVQVEDLVDAKSGKSYKRYTLTGEGLKATLLRDDQGRTVHVQGPGVYSGWAKGFKLPTKLEAAKTKQEPSKDAPGKDQPVKKAPSEAPPPPKPAP